MKHELNLIILYLTNALYWLYWYISVQVSAYTSFARVPVVPGLAQKRRKLDPSTNEPLFTSCTRDHFGTLDYIFYSGMVAWFCL